MSTIGNSGSSNSSGSSESSSSSESSNDRYMGRVKWFNNKTGYGFVTIVNGHKKETDIFIHHSSIKVDMEQYKYLVQGEYIEFSMIPTTVGNHAFQAANVSGIGGGKLMCETRRDNKITRFNYIETDTDFIEPVQRNTYSNKTADTFGVRQRNIVNYADNSTENNWSVVKNSKSKH